MNKNILVTGGAGFIGSHLCEKLLNDENHVICVDNLFTGSMDNIKNLIGNSRFSFLEHDIITPFFIDEKIDEIYNFACPASPIHYQVNPIRTIKANTIGVINVLGLARKHKAKVLQASTSEVYGDPEIHPQVEDYRGNVNPIGIRACYDEGKRCAEALFFDYHRQHNLKIKVARIFNTYGPRMRPDDGRVVSNFIVQALHGEPLTIYGKGSQTRSFCYVDDLVRGLVGLMEESSIDFTGPVNIGNPFEFSMFELAEKILTFTSSRSNIVYENLPLDDPKRRKPDISLAKKEFKWEPQVALEDGLSKTIEYFRQI
ncbi:MAG: UDP-glucuronic acid decarboxylase family protein [Candidatus Magasanikbacteria bacterium]